MIAEDKNVTLKSLRLLVLLRRISNVFTLFYFRLKESSQNRNQFTDQNKKCTINKTGFWIVAVVSTVCSVHSRFYRPSRFHSSRIDLGLHFKFLPSCVAVWFPRFSRRWVRKRDEATGKAEINFMFSLRIGKKAEIEEQEEDSFVFFVHHYKIISYVTFIACMCAASWVAQFYTFRLRCCRQNFLEFRRNCDWICWIGFCVLRYQISVHFQTLKT